MRAGPGLLLQAACNGSENTRRRTYHRCWSSVFPTRYVRRPHSDLPTVAISFRCSVSGLVIVGHLALQRSRAHDIRHAIGNTYAQPAIDRTPARSTLPTSLRQLKIPETHRKLALQSNLCSHHRNIFMMTLFCLPPEQRYPLPGACDIPELCEVRTRL